MRYREGRFHAWTMANGLTSPYILNILRDIDRSLWVRTHPAIGHLSADSRLAMEPRDWTSYKTARRA